MVVGSPFAAASSAVASSIIIALPQLVLELRLKLMLIVAFTFVNIAFVAVAFMLVIELKQLKLVLLQVITAASSSIIASFDFTLQVVQPLDLVEQEQLVKQLLEQVVQMAFLPLLLVLVDVHTHL